jgi:DNA transformation protein
MKRGRPVLLNYYRVDDGLWQDRERLLQLSSLRSVRQGKSAISAINETGLRICQT